MYQDPVKKTFQVKGSDQLYQYYWYVRYVGKEKLNIIVG